MSTSRISAGPAAGRAIGVAGVAQPAAGISTHAARASAAVAPLANLSQIQWASTWPRGWMAAAVPQHVRDFNSQVSKAQMALAFLAGWSADMAALLKAVQRQKELPSTAGQLRLSQALKKVQTVWAQRYAQTLGSLDECLVWSPTQGAGKVFALAGWNVGTLQAQQAGDRELLSFSLMGQDHAHGAWLAQQGRSSAASLHALAVAMAGLRIQLHSAEPLRFVVDERLWPTLQERFVVKGNGQRFPAGQWVAAPMQANPLSVQPQSWSAETTALPELWAQIDAVQQRVQQVYEQVAKFCEDAGRSVDDGGAQQLARMQQFAQAFAAAGQAPAYDWVLAVVPAVRAISKRRVARLLKTSGTIATAFLP